MAQDNRSYVNTLIDNVASVLRDCWHEWTVRWARQIRFWFIALVVGIVAGFVALFFRKGVFALQAWLYGSEDVDLLHSHASMLHWSMILCIPIIGGLAVGLISQFLISDGRIRNVADVIEGAALHEGRVEVRNGLLSSLASFITLSSGGSTGREGPVVHLAAVLASWVSDRIKADGITGRDLLGCAVAAAVSASFNAPIAGAIFALEVVLRHFAVHAFAPIVVAAAAGTVINRIEFNEATEFVIQSQDRLQFYTELPAFLFLGILCGLVAVVMMRSIFIADDLGTRVQNKVGLPRWVRPAVSGALLGAIAIPFPHIIGVGYETTLRALHGDYLMQTAIVFVGVKVVAVAITVAGRMGGGVFSPALMIGALTGLAFGAVATSIFPAFSSSPSLYAFAGMGAVAAAVMGAPISTTLIVFELTGQWEIGLTVMVAVSLSTALASRLVHRSFFLSMIERRGLHLAAGPQAYLLGMYRADGVMRPLSDPASAEAKACWEMIGEGTYIDAAATLEVAMPMFDRSGGTFIPVVTLTGDNNAPELQGALFHVDALKTYNRALAATAAEEHS